MKKVKLTPYKTCKTKRQKGTATALEIFICKHEPYREKEANEFRADLLAALEELLND